MHENKLHPTGTGEVAPFKNFLPFVKVADPTLKKWFVEKLEEAYNATKELWSPANCYAAEEMERRLNSAKQKGKIKEFDFEVRTFIGGMHYLLVLRKNERELVIDPFGVPGKGISSIDFMRNPRLITPFFGEMELASPRHREVYRESKPLGERGYHRMII